MARETPVAPVETAESLGTVDTPGWRGELL